MTPFISTFFKGVMLCLDLIVFMPLLVILMELITKPAHDDGGAGAVYLIGIGIGIAVILSFLLFISGIFLGIRNQLNKNYPRYLTPSDEKFFRITIYILVISAAILLFLVLIGKLTRMN